MIENLLGQGVKSKAKHVVSSLYDLYEDVFKLRSPLIPPRSLNYNDFFEKRRTRYLANFQASGGESFEVLRQETGFSPQAKIIDLGSGLGRLAKPMAGYLSSEGRYHGYDIVLPAVEWCTQSYSAYPGFSFTLIPTQDSGTHYAAMDSRFSKVLSEDNIERVSEVSAAERLFGELDNTTDLVFSFSVFTHLFEEQILEYLKETYRVLKLGGRSFHTFFLLNERAFQGIRSGQASHLFPHTYAPGVYCDSLECPLNTIGFDEQKALDLYVKAGFDRTKLRIVRGSWFDQNRKVSTQYYQDAIVAEK